MSIIYLDWKTFSVNLEKANKTLKNILSNNYDGLVANELSLSVMFKEDYSNEDSIAISDYWDSINSSTFLPTMTEIITSKVNDAIVFGNQIVVDAAVENISMGITQAGKTRQVSDYCVNLQYYLKTGSLYAAIDELNGMINQPPPDTLSPFITVARLTTYKTKIQTYLGLI